MKKRTQQGFTLIELLVVITIIALLASLAMPVYTTVQEKGNITKGINNCRQIIIAMKAYASDNGGQYPDAAAASGTGGTGTASDANTAFRELFKSQVLTDERVFGCPASPYNPDGNIGSAPNYEQAVAIKENHWDLVANLSDSSPASNPVVFENAKNDVFNPTWDVSAVARAVKGRVWSGPSIIIGLNDNSVTKMKLATDGTLAPPKSSGGGGDSKNQFQMNLSDANSTPPTVLGPSGGT